MRDTAEIRNCLPKSFLQPLASLSCAIKKNNMVAGFGLSFRHAWRIPFLHDDVSPIPRFDHSFFLAALPFTGSLLLDVTVVARPFRMTRQKGLPSFRLQTTAKACAKHLKNKIEDDSSSSVGSHPRRRNANG